jgi:predicted alpha/beta-hydrolase family hydrolase
MEAMSGSQEFLDLSSDKVSVRGFLHCPVVPSAGCIVLAHGAGTNCNAPLLIALANEFCAVGLTCLRCDLPFRQTRPHGPPQRGDAERDQQGLRAALAAITKQAPGSIYLGGHSYGGRQSSMLAAADPDLLDGLLLLSYPLHPPRRPHELRTGHFSSLQTPSLFVHGTRDGFGSIDEIETALQSIPARTGLLPIAGSGHELMAKTTQRELPKTVVDAFLRFQNNASA